MITIIVGSRNQLFEKLNEKLLVPFVKTNSVERKNARDISSAFDEIQTPSLFGEKKLFVFSGLFDDEDAKEFFLDRISEISNAPHDVLIATEKLLAADLKKIGDHAKVEHVAEKKTRDASFDPFVLANAFATGDKKKTWIAFSEVAANGDEMEPVHGMIWWKLKSMMGKRGTYSDEKLKSMARELVSAYHESRLGGLGMRERLEKFFLSL